jgi:hypothetical protein
LFFLETERPFQSKGAPTKPSLTGLLESIGSACSAGVIQKPSTGDFLVLHFVGTPTHIHHSFPIKELFFVVYEFFSDKESMPLRVNKVYRIWLLITPREELLLQQAVLHVAPEST